MNAYECALGVVEGFLSAWDEPEAPVLSAEESLNLLRRVAEALFSAYADGLYDGHAEAEPVTYEVATPTRSDMNAFARQVVNSFVNDDEEDEDDGGDLGFAGTTPD